MVGRVGLSIVSSSQALPAQMANRGRRGTAAGALIPPAATEIAWRSASVLSLLSGRLGKSLTSGTETPASGSGQTTGLARQFSPQHKTKCGIPVSSSLNEATLTPCNSVHGWNCSSTCRRLSGHEGSNGQEAAGGGEALPPRRGELTPFRDGQLASSRPGRERVPERSGGTAPSALLSAIPAEIRKAALEAQQREQARRAAAAGAQNSDGEEVMLSTGCLLPGQ